MHLAELRSALVACVLVAPTLTCSDDAGGRECATVRAELVQCRKGQIAQWQPPETDEPAWIVSVSDLNRLPVAGTLGIPLGQVADVSAAVVAGNSLRTKLHSNSYLLRVQEVNGRALQEPVLLSFALAPGASADLANDAFALHRMRRGRDAQSLDDRTIAQLEQNYVGRAVRLSAYETGRFVGIPANMPPDVPLWQDTQFHFKTNLVVLRELD